MSLAIRIIEVNDGTVAVAQPDWLRAAEAVHRQLRTALPADYAGAMAQVFADGGRMCVDARADDVVGLALYRIYKNTADGQHLYVDDLVTNEGTRSSGVGAALFAHLEALACRTGCGCLTLDSGTHRGRAHKFYFREGTVSTSFHFGKPLEP